MSNEGCSKTCAHKQYAILYTPNKGETWVVGRCWGSTNAAMISFFIAVEPVLDNSQLAAAALAVGSSSSSPALAWAAADQAWHTTAQTPPQAGSSRLEVAVELPRPAGRTPYHCFHALPCQKVLAIPAANPFQ